MRRFTPLLVALTTLASSSALAATLETPPEVVRKLYAAFPAEGGVGVQNQTAQVLSRFFDPELVRLIRREADCTEARKGFCNLDVDPLWAVNFPGKGARASIVSGGAGTVQVTLHYPDGRKPYPLTYRLGRTEGGWRIRDIEEPDGASLKRQLSQEPPAPRP